MSDAGIIMPFPGADFTTHDNLRSEVILKRDEVIVHLFPSDPTRRNLNRLADICEAILTKRMPAVHGKYETIDVDLVAASGCATMPRDEINSDDLDWLRSEFPRLVAWRLAQLG